MLTEHEPTLSWMARIGSHEAMQERQQLRLAGQINAPIRGPRGLDKLVALMVKRKARIKEPTAELPHVVIPAPPVPKQAKRQWRGKSSN